MDRLSRHNKLVQCLTVILIVTFLGQNVVWAEEQNCLRQDSSRFIEEFRSLFVEAGDTDLAWQTFLLTYPEPEKNLTRLTAADRDRLRTIITGLRFPLSASAKNAFACVLKDDEKHAVGPDYHGKSFPGAAGTLPLYSELGLLTNDAAKNVIPWGNNYMGGVVAWSNVNNKPERISVRKASDTGLAAKIGAGQDIDGRYVFRNTRGDKVAHLTINGNQIVGFDIQANGYAYLGLAEEMVAFAFTKILARYRTVCFDSLLLKKSVFKGLSFKLKRRISRVRAKMIMREQRQRVMAFFEERIIIEQEAEFGFREVLAGDRGKELALLVDAAKRSLMQEAGNSPQLAGYKNYLNDLLARPQNKGKKISLRIAKAQPGKGKSALGRQAARYYLPDTDEVNIVFDEDFIRILVRAHALGHRKAAGWLFLERLTHELCHDNTIGSVVKERKEEENVVVENDLLLYKTFVHGKDLKNKVGDLLGDRAVLQDDDDWRKITANSLYSVIERAVEQEAQLLAAGKELRTDIVRPHLKTVYPASWISRLVHFFYPILRLLFPQITPGKAFPAGAAAGEGMSGPPVVMKLTEAATDGDWKKVLRLKDTALQQVRDSSFWTYIVHNVVARAYLRLCMYKGAVIHSDAASFHAQQMPSLVGAGVNPFQCEPMFIRGCAFFNINRHTEAIAVLETVLKQHHTRLVRLGELGTVRDILGRAYFLSGTDTGQFRKAIEYFEAVENIEPVQENYACLAMLYLVTGDDPDKVAEYLDRIEPQAGDSGYEYIPCLIDFCNWAVAWKADDREGAAEHWQRAFSYSPNIMQRPGLYFSKLMVVMSGGKVSEMRGCFQAVLDEYGTAKETEISEFLLHTLCLRADEIDQLDFMTMMKDMQGFSTDQEYIDWLLAPETAAGTEILVPGKIEVLKELIGIFQDRGDNVLIDQLRSNEAVKRTSELVKVLDDNPVVDDITRLTTAFLKAGKVSRDNYEEALGLVDKVIASDFSKITGSLTAYLDILLSGTLPNIRREHLGLSTDVAVELDTRVVKVYEKIIARCSASKEKQLLQRAHLLLGNVFEAYDRYQDARTRYEQVIAVSGGAAEKVPAFYNIIASYYKEVATVSHEDRKRELARAGVKWYERSLKLTAVSPVRFIFAAELYRIFGQTDGMFKALACIPKNRKELARQDWPEPKTRDYVQNKLKQVLERNLISDEQEDELASLLEYVISQKGNPLGLFRTLVRWKNEGMFWHEGMQTRYLNAVFTILEETGHSLAFRRDAVELIRGLNLTVHSDRLLAVLQSEYASFTAPRTVKSYFPAAVELLRTCYTPAAVLFSRQVWSDAQQWKRSKRTKINQLAAFGDWLDAVVTVPKERIAAGSGLLQEEDWNEVLPAVVFDSEEDIEECLLELETGKLAERYRVVPAFQIRQGIVRMREQGTALEAVEEELSEQQEANRQECSEQEGYLKQKHAEVDICLAAEQWGAAHRKLIDLVGGNHRKGLVGYEWLVANTEAARKDELQATLAVVYQKLEKVDYYLDRGPETVFQEVSVPWKFYKHALKEDDVTNERILEVAKSFFYSDKIDTALKIMRVIPETERRREERLLYWEVKFSQQSDKYQGEYTGLLGELDGRHTAVAVYYQGKLLRENGEPVGALEKFQEVFDRVPAVEEIFDENIFSYLDLIKSVQDPERYVECYERILRERTGLVLGSSRFAAHSIFAPDMYIMCGCYQQAITVLNGLMHIKFPKNLEGFRCANLGSCYEDMGRPEEARAVYQQAWKAPATPETKLAVGASLARLSWRLREYDNLEVYLNEIISQGEQEVSAGVLTDVIAAAINGDENAKAVLQNLVTKYDHKVNKVLREATTKFVAEPVIMDKLMLMFMSLAGTKQTTAASFSEVLAGLGTVVSYSVASVNIALDGETRELGTVLDKNVFAGRKMVLEKFQAVHSGVSRIVARTVRRQAVDNALRGEIVQQIHNYINEEYPFVVELIEEEQVIDVVWDYVQEGDITEVVQSVLRLIVKRLRNDYGTGKLADVPGLPNRLIEEVVFNDTVRGKNKEGLIALFNRCTEYRGGLHVVYQRAAGQERIAVILPENIADRLDRHLLAGVLNSEFVDFVYSFISEGEAPIVVVGGNGSQRQAVWSAIYGETVLDELVPNKLFLVQTAEDSLSRLSTALFYGASIDKLFSGSAGTRGAAGDYAIVVAPGTPLDDLQQEEQVLLTALSRHVDFDNTAAKVRPSGRLSKAALDCRDSGAGTEEIRQLQEWIRQMLAGVMELERMTIQIAYAEGQAVDLQVVWYRNEYLSVRGWPILLNMEMLEQVIFESVPQATGIESFEVIDTGIRFIDDFWSRYLGHREMLQTSLGDGYNAVPVLVMFRLIGMIDQGIIPLEPAAIVKGLEYINAFPESMTRAPYLVCAVSGVSVKQNDEEVTDCIALTNERLVPELDVIKRIIGHGDLVAVQPDIQEISYIEQYARYKLRVENGMITDLAVLSGADLVKVGDSFVVPRVLAEFVTVPDAFNVQEDAIMDMFHEDFNGINFYYHEDTHTLHLVRLSSVTGNRAVAIDVNGAVKEYRDTKVKGKQFKVTNGFVNVDHLWKGVSGADDAKSYTGFGGTDRESHPVIESGFEDISQESLVMLAKDLLLNDDARFRQKDAEMAQGFMESTGVSPGHAGLNNLRIVTVPGLSIDGHYGMGGEVNNHRLPTVYVSEALWKRLERQRRAGDTDVIIKMADYIYHKYMELYLTYIEELTAAEAHRAVDHSDYRREEGFINEVTFSRLQTAREKLLSVVQGITAEMLGPLVARLDEVYVDSTPPTADYLAEQLICHGPRLDSERLVSAMHNDGIIDWEDFRVVGDMNLLVKDALRESSFSELDKVVLVDVLAITYLNDQFRLDRGFKRELRRDLTRIGYGAVAEWLITIMDMMYRRQKLGPPSEERERKLYESRKRSYYLFIAGLEELIGREGEVLEEIGLEESSSVPVSKFPESEVLVPTAYWSNMFAATKKQGGLMEDLAGKKPAGVIVQHIQDLGAGQLNWEEAVRRHNVEMNGVTMAYILDETVSTVQREQLKAISSANLIFIDDLDDVELEVENSSRDRIVYSASAERLAEYRDQGYRLVARSTKVPISVVELTWCLLMLSTDDISQSYRDFTQRLEVQGLIVDGANGDLEDEFYIVLPQIKEEVVKMWQRLEDEKSLENVIGVWA